MLKSVRVCADINAIPESFILSSCVLIVVPSGRSFCRTNAKSNRE